MKMKWAGVMPATTTAFDENLAIDHAFVARHAKWLIDHGCTGIVTPGSLGESATLSFDEKIAVAIGGAPRESTTALRPPRSSYRSPAPARTWRTSR